MKAPLTKALERIQVSLALQGKLGYRLPPALWEDARIRLQSQYRMATGEDRATLVVVDGHGRVG